MSPAPNIKHVHSNEHFDVFDSTEGILVIRDRHSQATFTVSYVESGTLVSTSFPMLMAGNIGGRTSVLIRSTGPRPLKEAQQWGPWGTEGRPPSPEQRQGE